MDKTNFVKTDDNRIINEKYIRWVKKANECMEICSKFTGCSLSPDVSVSIDTLKVCKYNSPESYDKLNKYF